MENEKTINDRTYTQVTVTLTQSIVKELKDSVWFETLGINVDVEEQLENGTVVCVIYGHGIGRNLFTQRLVHALIHTFRSKL